MCLKKNSFIDFILQNKYIILFVTIVLILAWLGVVRVLIEVGTTVFLVLVDIYLGKRIQEDDAYIKKMFKDKEDEVIYKVKDDEEE